MHLVLLSRDLMLTSRIDGVAKQHDILVTHVSDQEKAIAAVAEKGCQILFIDLQLAGLDITSLVSMIRASGIDGVRIIACGPHVHEQRLKSAQEAGCDLVVTKGQFDRDANSILGFAN